MGMSDYYQKLREKIGNELIFMPAVAGIIRNERGEILFGRKHNEENWGLIAGAIVWRDPSSSHGQRSGRRDRSCYRTKAHHRCIWWGRSPLYL